MARYRIPVAAFLGADGSCEGHKQDLLAISREITTGQFSNDWYYTLDLHQRMFDWFFAGIGTGSDYPLMARGERTKTPSGKREFLTRVRTKDYPGFESEAQALRVALLGS